MPIISAESAPTFDIPGITFTGLAAPSRGAVDTSVWRVVMQPGTPANLHRLSREEILVAISGTARVSIGGIESDFAAGGAVIVPADTDFSLSNPGPAPFEAVAVLPVGGRASLPGGEPFTPPWAE